MPASDSGGASPTPGAIVLGDRVRHLLGLARRARVVAADHALEARVLLAAPDHLGQEIRLAQPRGAARGLGGRRCQPLGEPGRHRLEPLGLVAQAAEPLHPHHAGEGVDALGGRVLEIGLPVEACVLEARGEHALVAAPHLVEPALVAVPRRDETWHQPAVWGLDREEALVLAQRGDDDLARQVEVARIERAHERRRPLDEIHVDVEQLGIVDAAPLLAGRERLDLAREPRAAFLGIGHHHGRLERRRVRARRRDLDRAAAQEAMPLRLASRGEPERRHRHDLVAEQRHEPAHRAREARVVLEPAHRFRELEPRRHRREQRRQHLDRGTSGVVDGDGDVLALGRGDAAHVRRIGALPLAEAEQRLGRLAVRVERGLG